MAKKKYTLDDVDGNVYAIMAYVCKSMRREGKTNESATISRMHIPVTIAISLIYQ